MIYFCGLVGGLFVVGANGASHLAKQNSTQANALKWTGEKAVVDRVNGHFATPVECCSPVIPDADPLQVCRRLSRANGTVPSLEIRRVRFRKRAGFQVNNHILADRPLLIFRRALAKFMLVQKTARSYFSDVVVVPGSLTTWLKSL